MSLGLAEAADADGPAGRLAADAHRQVDETLAELRAVLLGYSPRALIEGGGLAPALADLVAGRPAGRRRPTRRAVRSGLARAVEHMSYVLVSEALTRGSARSGAARHGRGGGRVGGTWVLTVADDGGSGAHSSRRARPRQAAWSSSAPSTEPSP